MPQILITSQAEYNKAVKDNLHMKNELVIHDTKDFIVVKTNVTVSLNGRCKTVENADITIKADNNGIVAAQGKVTVNGYGTSNIIAKGNCKLNLFEGASGNVTDFCEITLKDKSKISANGNCTIHAYDEAAVSASGSSKVYTYQKATARGTDVTALSGSGESTLHGHKNCNIKAKDNCIVYAADNCTVQAADNCLVVAGNKTKIAAKDNCLIMTNDNPHLTLHDSCEHVNLSNVNDKNIMGTLKQMAQSKAVVERPYLAIQVMKDNLPPQRKEAVNRRLNMLGLKDQTSIKNHLYSLIEAQPAVKNQTASPSFEQQIETARKTGYVQGVCECVAAVGNDQNMGKKLLSEMNVNKDMAQKYANPETYKKLEQGIFAQNQEQKVEQTQGVKR